MTTEYLNNKTFEKIINNFQSSKKNKIKFEFLVEDISEAYKITGSKEYRALLKTLQKSYDLALEDFLLYQNQLALAFRTLSENIVNYAKFNLVDADDAIQEGILVGFEKINRFDSTKGKAFNYFTTILLNGLRQSYRSARNYNELKRKYLIFSEIKFKDQLPKKPKKG